MYDMHGIRAFQLRVGQWTHWCFGREKADDPIERDLRFWEEAAELMQARGRPRSQLDAVLDYVYSRPVGEVHQEVGGVMVTLAALCKQAAVSLEICSTDEITRAELRTEEIRAKNLSKPRFAK